MTKTTLRLPDVVMEQLRERSLAEGRSVNDIAIDALLRGLGQEHDRDALRALGKLLVRPTSKPYAAAEVAALRKRFALRTGDLGEELDWVRDSGWS